MKLSTHHDTPPPADFECFDNWLSRWMCESILAGQTYPRLPEIDDVHTIVDVGANCGATSVYFARCYPEATIHAIEPATATFDLLSHNAEHYPNIEIHKIGLHSVDRRAPLYAGAIDAGTASIFPRDGRNTEASEEIELRAARAWLAEQGIESIDLLKVDAEGCEADILENVGDMLPGISVIYVEYDTTEDRRRIDKLLEPTHDVCHGVLFLEQGEVIYVARRVLNDDAVASAITKFFFSRVGLGAPKSDA
jgi:FkbM family methyltransferase